MKTHYEQTLSQRAGRVDPDRLVAKCLELVAKGRDLAIVDAIRQVAEPGATSTFENFVKSQEGRRVYDYLAQILTAMGVDLQDMRGEITTQMLLAWQLVRYERAGKRAYVVSPGLQRRLLATEIRGLRCGDVRLPYPCIYIEVDPRLGFRVWHEITHWHEMYGLYLTDDETGLRVLTCGLGKGERADDSLSHFHLDLRDPERPLEDVLTAMCARVQAGEEQWAREQGFGQAHMDELLDSWTRPFRWAMALLFYLTHGQPDVEHVELNDELRALYRRRKKAKGTRLKKIANQIRDQVSRQRIVVGRHVPVDDRLPQTAGEARTLLTRSLVAGHWQRYHVGPGRAETVLRFREPFWRGRGEEGPAVHEVR